MNNTKAIIDTAKKALPYNQHQKRQLTYLEKLLTALEPEIVAGSSFISTYQAIADKTGISRQAVHRRLNCYPDFILTEPAGTVTKITIHPRFIWKDVHGLLDHTLALEEWYDKKPIRLDTLDPFVFQPFCDKYFSDKVMTPN